jgi:hypothetical protein
MNSLNTRTNEKPLHDGQAGRQVLKNLSTLSADLEHNPMADLRDMIRQMIDEDRKQGPKPKEPVATLSVTGQRILNAIAWLEKATSKDAFPPLVVSFFAGFHTTASYENARNALRRGKLIEHTYGGFVKLAEAGRRDATADIRIGTRKGPTPPPESDEFDLI